MEQIWKKRSVLNAHILCTDFDVQSLKEICARCSIQDARLVFDTDFVGNIIMLRPQANMNYMDVWFMQNLCIMQRLHQVDTLQKILEKKVNQT